MKKSTDGAYLVRESQSKPGEYTLSLYDGAVAHYRINQNPDGTCFIRVRIATATRKAVCTTEPALTAQRHFYFYYI